MMSDRFGRFLTNTQLAMMGLVNAAFCARQVRRGA
jgi:hypothetical protein